MSADHPHDERSTDAQLAEQLDMDIGKATERPDYDQLLARLADRDVDPVVEALLEGLVEHTQALEAETDALRDECESLRDELGRTHDVATTASGKTEQNASRLADVEDQQERTHDVAKSAIAKAQQLEADPDQQEDAEQLPAGIAPSSSPLDFFANCREQKVKELFVEQSNRQNTYRAITVAKRWPEFATERTDGSGVFMAKDDVEAALVAELGRKPHRQTVLRVWDTLVELGGQDLTEKSRQVGRRQDRTAILAMDAATAEGLLDQRYVGLDLLDAGADKATLGGVTPVVTGEAGATV